MRIARGSLALLCGLAIAGCSVDSGPKPPGAPDSAPELPDAAGPPPDGAPAPIDATPACTDQVQNVNVTGHHEQNEGLGGAGCLGQCHNGTLGEKYTAAGSVWNRRLEGGQPVEGAHIYVIDADGKVVEMISAQNGFFWTDEELAPPIRSYASACPDSIAMVANAGANCNAAGCHHSNEKIYVKPVPAL